MSEVIVIRSFKEYSEEPMIGLIIINNIIINLVYLNKKIIPRNDNKQGVITSGSFVCGKKKIHPFLFNFFYF